MPALESTAPGGSLARRLFLLTSCFAVICVVLIALVLGEAYRSNVERRFAELVTANLYNLLSSVEPGEDGRLAGSPNLGDARFLNFGSGWYWSVTSLSDPTDRISSTSLAGGTIPDPDDVPFDANFRRIYQFTDASDQQLTAVEAQAFLGAGNSIYSFKLTGNRGELSEETSAFIRQLTFLLAMFALGFIAASFFIVTLGLRPISLATQRLADIREGRASHLDGRFPKEIQPLIEETNALIDSNSAVVERARTQVGNLAHSLKTPIAVLRNEAGSAGPELKTLILEQTSAMQHQVDNYLKRARIAARHATITSATQLRPVLERLVRVISKLNPTLHVNLEEECDWNRVFAGEQHDLEEIIGNVLENAARFARANISISVTDTEIDGRSAFALLVADDGPGMSAAEAQVAVKRGMRLDERAPGSGLGLAIVNDYMAEYKGILTLGESPSGGLAVVMTLPAR